ncbi:MAG TPA: glycine betaine ABC transporter substrate-binding protein [Candidatus Limnocylindrales bacterium]|jgi:osmoprotectant transport system substrate-binding protein
MRLARRLTLGALLLAAVSACNAGGGSTPAPSKAPTGSSAATTAPVSSAASQAPQQSAAGNLPTVKIGTVDFDEARVVGEIYAQVLENAGYTVDRTGFGLGDRSVLAPAIESGQIDLQPEYIGSRISYEVKQANPSGPPPSGGITGPTGDSATNLTDLQQLLTPKNLTVLNYTPAVDTNAFVVRSETATQFNLTTMSDTAAVQTQLKWGLATDCPTNPLCGAPNGALSQYGLTADTIAGATLLAACSAPMADALKNKTVDVGELCSTQPDIAVNGWVLLQDDKHTQPADNISPIVRDDFLAKVDQTAFEKLLNDVSAEIDTATLTNLYTDIAVNHKDVKDVAAQWLKDKGFVQ